jgi:ABC-type transport system substrate-binding protein
MSDRIDRRSFLARGAATGAGLAAVSVSGGLLAACGSSGSSGSGGSGSTGTHPDGVSTATPKKGGQLVIGVEAEEKGFSPTLGTFDTTGIMYARTVFDPLMIIDASGKPQPYLAESVTPNADFTVWTITVRSGVTFHNGAPCDGAAVAANLQAHRDSLLTSTTVKPIASLASSGQTCTVTMSSPWVPFDYYLTGGIGSQIAFVAEPTWLKSGSQTNPVGTGPFVFQEWVPNDHFTATKNPHYWRAGMPYLDSVTYKPIPDSNQLLSSLQSGSVDIIHTSAAEVTKAMRADTSLAYVDDATKIAGEPDMDCLILNLSKAPFNNLKVRQAAAYAIDSAQYVKVINYGVNPTSNGPFPKSSPYWLADNGYPTANMSKAKQLVAEAAKETGGPIKVDLACVSTPGSQRVAQYIQQQLQTAGMQVTINAIQQVSYINNALTGNFDAQLWRQFGAVAPDLNYIFWSPTTVTGGFSINMARNTDPDMQAALVQGRQATSSSDQVSAYQSVNRLMSRDLPYIWYGQTVWSIGAKENVQNFNGPTTPAGQKAFGMISGAFWPTTTWKS